MMKNRWVSTRAGLSTKRISSDMWQMLIHICCYMIMQYFTESDPWHFRGEDHYSYLQLQSRKWHKVCIGGSWQWTLLRSHLKSWDLITKTRNNDNARLSHYKQNFKLFNWKVKMFHRLKTEDKIFYIKSTGQMEPHLWYISDDYISIKKNIVIGFVSMGTRA